MPDLSPRSTTPISGNINNIRDGKVFYLPHLNTNYNDIGLLNLSQSITDPSIPLGIVAFVNPEDAIGFNVSTAGYPVSVDLSKDQQKRFISDR